MTPPNVSLIFVMVCFWATLWLVHRFLIRPITQVLDERNEHIDHADKEWTSKNEAFLSATRRLEDELSEAARNAARIREENRAAALSKRQERMEAARDRAEEELTAAVNRLAGEAEAARVDLRGHAATLAGELATRLLGREVTT